MRVVDLNLLIYAVNRDAPHHEAARIWLEGTLSGRESVGLPWLVLLGFLRVSTHARILPHPLTVDRALSLVDGWLARNVTRIVHPGPEHWSVLRDLLGQAGTAGNLTTDAHLAALAIENGAVLCSTDRDFGRFAQLRWLHPFEEPPRA